MRIGLKFSATIFPLDGNGFFRYHPQIERIYPLSPQFGKILGAVIFIIISFGAVYVYCIGGLSYNLPRKVVLSKKTRRCTMQEIEVKNDFDAKILINGVPDHRLIIADKESGFLEALELQISEYFKEKNNNHEQRGC